MTFERAGRKFLRKRHLSVKVNFSVSTEEASRKGNRESDGADVRTDFEKTILVTGGAGFIGVNFIEYFARKYPCYRIVNLDAMTYAAHPQAVQRQKRMRNVTVVKGDICNADLVNLIFDDYEIAGVIHFAAESHIDSSITNPAKFIRTNVNGTATLLDAAMRHWGKSDLMNRARFHHISTDEVFGSLGDEGFFTEETPYAPCNPYSSTKAAADLLVKAYVKTYGLNATISNCSNNYGFWQHAEKLIPTVIRKCLIHEHIPIYGTGKNIRDWIWVGDHCKAVDVIYHEGKPGESYNVGSRNEHTNLEVVAEICRLLDELSPWQGHRYRELVGFVDDRPGHDYRYAIDPEKIERELGWKAEAEFSEGLCSTLEWYLGSGRSVLEQI